MLTYRKSDAPFIAGHDFIEISLAGIEPPPISKSVMQRDLKKVNPDLLRSILSLHFPPLYTHSLTSPHFAFSKRKLGTGEIFRPRDFDDFRHF